MRLLAAAAAALAAFGLWGAVSAPANAQVYPEPTINLLCVANVNIELIQGEGVVTVTVTDLNTGDPVSGITVIFQTTAGSVSPNPVVTDSFGMARTVLDPGDSTEQIEVRAFAEDTSCRSQFQQVLAETLSEAVSALPATGSGGAAGGSSLPWAWLALGSLALVSVAALGRKLARQ